MDYIARYLEKLGKLDPIPSETDPVLKKGEDIKAFIFDIYGTLLISSSGDINQTEVSAKNLRSALKEAKIQVPDAIRPGENSRMERILEDYVSHIKNYLNENSNEKILYPEVNILGIWEDVIAKAVKKKWLKTTKESDIRYLTFVFELLSNHVYPMPGMKEVVTVLDKMGKIMGIVSNSQFYTPMIMNYFLGNDELDSEEIKPFDPDLTVYSFKLQRAKPDISLFNQVIPVLKEKHGLEPADALFIGNDMYNDIYPAAEAGFQTALFAGDRRSLRWREEKEEVKGIRADFIITELVQLLEILKK
jgi:putative hydrolase of the HAD superfamily